MPEYAALDLETTGLDPAQDRVIELGAVAFTPERVLERLDLLVDPGRGVPASVVRLTGIQPQELEGAQPQREGLKQLAEFLDGRQPVGHGAGLDVDFLSAEGLWPDGREIIDTLHLARILLPNAASHSLPLLALELGLEQPRPHRALGDADATRQLFLRLRQEAAQLDDSLKESMLALVAPYEWAVARFFADALTAEAPPAAAELPARAGTERRPRGELPREDPAFLAGLVGPEGPLAASLPGYEFREAQLQMLLAVAQTFKRGGTLVVEAGTGTGKSVAYLVPALARALARNERVVVSTATHSLQEQLLGKDIPALRGWLPWDFRACLLKGRSNYVSLRRWRRFLAEPCRDAEALRFKLKLLVWLHGTETGDRSELRLQGREEVLWAQVASDQVDCAGLHCTGEDCFVHRARAEAEQADLVIVNHALLMTDAKHRLGGAGEGVLPEFEHLVVDEAHHLEDAGTSALRREVEAGAVVALLDRLRANPAAGASEQPSADLLGRLLALSNLGLDQPALQQVAERVPAARQAVEDLFRAVAGLRPEAEAGHRDESLRLDATLREKPAFAEPVRLAEAAGAALAGLESSLGAALAGARGWLGGREPDPGWREAEVIRGRLREAGDLVFEAFVEPDPESVYWVTAAARGGSVAVRSAPVEVAELIGDGVLRNRSTVVLTSASLAVGGSFDYFRSRIGLVREPETLRLASPFNYLEQALVCLPDRIPDVDSEEFGPALVDAIAEVAVRIGGRMLVLFTSHQMLRDTYHDLKQRPDLDDVLILGQGLDGQRPLLVKAFTETARPLLLGTASFWEGIDLPGDQLSCVVIVRLPFPSPADPVVAARSERFPDPFRSYALPQAVLRLRQGFGRLIRTAADRGAVVILDSRISRRDYGNAFLAALPPAAIYDGALSEMPATIERWLEGE